MIGLFIFVGGGAHYLYLWLNARQQRKFFENFIREAKVSAWGNSGVPGIADLKEEAPAPVPSPAAAAPAEEGSEGPRNRKERRFQKKAIKKDAAGNEDSESGTSTPIPQVIGSAGVGRRKVVAGNGKVLIVNATGEVFLVEENEDGEEVELKLDINEIESPKFQDTAMCRLPVWIFNKTVGRFLGKKQEELAEYEEFVEGEEAAAADDAEGEARKEKKKPVAKPGTPVKVEKTGGLPRRKVARK